MARETIVTDSGRFHAVRFYRESDNLCRIVADYLIEGFEQSQPAIIIATPDHSTAIRNYLTADGHDALALEQSGQLVSLDATETLEQFIVDGMPDSRRFRRTLTPVLERANGGRGMIRAYGEMVDLLWQGGQTDAATRLERLWNSLAHTHSFALLCGYALGALARSAAVNEICSLHSHVVTDHGAATLAH
jgi:hypothetical protein